MTKDNLPFEWDDNKRNAVLEKHGLDFIDAITIFAGDVLTARRARKKERDLYDAHYPHRCA